MKIYLARHGETATQNLQPIDALSDVGHDKMKRLAFFLAPLQIHVQAILHSEKKRAEQTAVLLANAFISELYPKVQPGLKPNDDVAEFANEISSIGQDILAVGHLPFMSRLVSKLVTGNEDKEIVVFKPGTIVCLEEIASEVWVMNWMVNPDLIA